MYSDSRNTEGDALNVPLGVAFLLLPFHWSSRYFFFAAFLAAFFTAFFAGAFLVAICLFSLSMVCIDSAIIYCS